MAGHALLAKISDLEDSKIYRALLAQLGHDEAAVDAAVVAARREASLD